MTEKEFKRLLEGSATREQLIETMTDIYARLNCNEDGEFTPQDSVAAHSGADFVDCTNHVINELTGNLKASSQSIQ